MKLCPDFACAASRLQSCPMQRPAIELDRFSDLVSTIYDCAIDPHLWPTAIEQIARLVEGSGGLILMIDLIEQRSRLYVDWNVGAALGRTFSEHYYADNPLREAFPEFEVDEPYNIAMVMASERWRETRVYREFGRPNGWLDNVGVNLLRTPARSASLSIVRSERAGFAGPRELEIMRLLSPHLRRAVSIADLIEMRELTARTFESSFDALAVPIVLVDRAGGIVHANRAAQDLFSSGDPVRSERGVLKAPASKRPAQPKLSCSSSTRPPATTAATVSSWRVRRARARRSTIPASTTTMAPLYWY